MAVEASSEEEKEPLKPTIKRREHHTLVTFADDNLNVTHFYIWDFWESDIDKLSN